MSSFRVQAIHEAGAPGQAPASFCDIRKLGSLTGARGFTDLTSVVYTIRATLRCCFCGCENTEAPRGVPPVVSTARLGVPVMTEYKQRCEGSVERGSGITPEPLCASLAVLEARGARLIQSGSRSLQLIKVCLVLLMGHPPAQALNALAKEKLIARVCAVSGSFFRSASSASCSESSSLSLIMVCSVRVHLLPLRQLLALRPRSPRAMRLEAVRRAEASWRSRRWTPPN